MRNENEHCVREVARLEQAASKLQTLGVVLNNRRTSMLDEQAVAAAKEAATRYSKAVLLSHASRCRITRPPGESCGCAARESMFYEFMLLVYGLIDEH